MVADVSLHKVKNHIRDNRCPLLIDRDFPEQYQKRDWVYLQERKTWWRNDLVQKKI